MIVAAAHLAGQDTAHAAGRRRWFRKQEARRGKTHRWRLLFNAMAQNVMQQALMKRSQNAADRHSI
jgi:hypothetical protein